MAEVSAILTPVTLPASTTADVPLLLTPINLDALKIEKVSGPVGTLLSAAKTNIARAAIRSTLRTNAPNWIV